jgi:Fe(3+) dicitrate transport protein
MRFAYMSAASAVAILSTLATSATAQEAPEPAPAGQLPPVEVIQKQPSPAPAAKKKSAAKKQVSPAPQPPASSSAFAGPERTQDGRVVDKAPNLSPVNPASSILPNDMQDYVGAGTKVTESQIDELRPKDNHEILATVPGIMVVNDDGMSRHSGIGLRGSPVRRSRKVLVLEDGQSINFSSYLDPSTHYTPPTERVEGVEVLRGYNIPFAPLTNHGVVNFQNLSPFGADETVISASIGTTEGANKSVNNTRHVHTRQGAGNVGVVASYTGSEAGGAWDNEVLRYNDFYGALGWKGTDQDLTISGMYFRQRDNYDEDNYEGTEADFFANGRRKSGNPDIGDGASDANTYNADYYKLQLAHNLYIDDETTLSTRVYGHDHERNRFSAREEFGPDFYMRGRNRHYRYWGADSRLEFANRELFGGGTSQDIQVGISYERHTMRNCTSFGELGQTLNANNTGNCFADEGLGDTDTGRLEKFQTDAYTAFIQSAMHLTRDFTLTPGVRFVHYNVDRDGVYAGPGAPIAGDTPYPGDIEAGDLVGVEKQTFNHVLPGVAFAWDAGHRNTVYGGYHRGFTPSVARGEFYPLPEEIGDNFQIGIRSSAIKGLTFDLAYFHSRIDDYQIKEAFTAENTGANVFGTVDKVTINGFEIGSRADSQPFTGGRLNFFGQANYTFADSVVSSGVDLGEDGLPGGVGDDADTNLKGNYVPEVPRHFATLTVGFEERGLWDASLSWTYIGEFYTDLANTPYGVDDEGVNGLVPDVWLLSARANYTIPGTATTLFVAGQNLLDEFYIADRADGMKPGIGRTLWAGFKMKLQ